MRHSIKKLILVPGVLCSSLLLAETALTQVDGVKVIGQNELLEERSESPNSKLVIGEKKIRQFNDRTAGEILRRLPGVTFGGSPGESKDVRMRGLDKEYTQVLINGQRVPGGGEKREFQLDLIPADMIERIEIIRSPTANMDSQGIAGTINIILKQTPNSQFLTATLGLSKLGNKDVNPNASILYGDKVGDFSYLISINTQQRDVIKDKSKDKFKADGSADKSEKEYELKKFDEIQIAPRFDWKINSKNSLSFNPNYSISKEDKEKEKLKFKGDGSSDGKETEDEDKKRINWGFESQYKHKLNSNTNLAMTIMFQESKEIKDKIKGQYKSDGSLDKNELEDDDKKDTEISTKFSGVTLINDNHIFEYGLEYIDKDRTKDKNKIEIKNGVSKNKSEGKDKYTLEENRINAYILDEYSLSDRHIFTPGIRFEWTDTSSEDGANNSVNNSDSQWNPSLHYLFHWTSSDDVRVGIARTVRRPKFDELGPFTDEKDGTQDKPDKVGNPYLTPETAIGFDVGIQHYFENKKGLLSANVFYRDIKDKIHNQVLFNNTTGRYEETPQNEGDANLQGIELEANYDLNSFIPGFSITTNLTFMDGEITDKETGEKLPFDETPDYVYNIGFEHKFLKTFEWGMNYNQVGEREKVSLDSGKRSEEVFDPEHRLDLYFKKRLSKTFELSFSANNLLETERDKHKTNYKTDGSIENTEHEVEKSNRIFSISLIGRF